jgi:hypothetical protein
MQVKSAIMMRILLNRFTKSSPEAVLKSFAVQDKELLDKININTKDVLPAFSPAAARVEKIHYSWLVSSIQMFPEAIQPLATASLPNETCQRLNQTLNLNPSSQFISPILKNYLIKMIYNNLKGSEDVIPLEYLSPFLLSPLGEWNKHELVELIEFIGIHDLSEEIRYIVNKKILQNVYNCLSSKEQQYLRICLHLKEKVTTPKLGLDKWGGNCEKLKTALQTRGLVRLAKALSGEHPTFMWYLSHILDTGRGQALIKYYSKAAVPGITVILAQQVSNLMNFLKKKS